MSAPERWRRIEGIDGDYSVSDMGRLRNDCTGLILKEIVSKKDGYSVHLFTRTATGTRSTYWVHQMVARAFIGEPTGPVVRHLDDVKLNNRYDNLAYGTQADNMADAQRNGLVANAWTRTECAVGHPFDEANTYRPKGKPPVCRACYRSYKAKYRDRAKQQKREAA